MHLDTRRRALTGRGRHADAAIQVVRNDREDEDDDEGGERPIDHIGQERQLEEIEADVGAELRVGNPEVLTVDEQQPLFPLRLHTGGGEQGEEERHHSANQPGAAGDEIVVAGEEFLLRARHSSLWRRAVGEKEIEPQQGEEHPEEDEGQDDLGAQHRAPHIGSVERVEPEEVGIEPCDSSQRQGDDDERGGEHGQDDSASPTEPGGTTSLRYLFTFRMVGRFYRSPRTRPCRRSGHRSTQSDPNRFAARRPVAPHRLRSTRRPDRSLLTPPQRPPSANARSRLAVQPPHRVGKLIGIVGVFSDLEQSAAHRIKRNGTQLFVPCLSGVGIATHRLDDLVERCVDRRLVRRSVGVGISNDNSDGIRAAPPDAVEKGALLFHQDLLEGSRATLSARARSAWFGSVDTAASCSASGSGSDSVSG